MKRLSIRHETLYRYEQAVSFGPQRLMVRPRDSHADRLVEASLELSPRGDTRWVYDAMGNCLCLYQPRGVSTELKIVSNLVIERFPAPMVPLEVDNPHTAMPMVYSLADRTVLQPFIVPATDMDPSVLQWVRGHMGMPDEPALDFLQRLTSAIQTEFRYGARDQLGTQTPSETINSGAGTCRDFAWLMIESLRRLGYAARFVTGYLYSPKHDRPNCEGDYKGASATHAWCDVFLPGLGWLEFDPTNGLVESPDLISIGATRTPDEAYPISGSIIGDPRSCEMFVSVDVHMMDGPSRSAAA
jgi:transglutaminase-like putative cysteine protease